MTDVHDRLRAYGSWIDEGFAPFEPAALREHPATAPTAAPAHERHDPPEDQRRGSARGPGRWALVAVAVAATVVLVAGLLSARARDRQLQVGGPPAGWHATSSFDVPEGRRLLAGPTVWTGREVLLPLALTEPGPAGLVQAETPAYDPVTDTWRTLPGPPGDLRPAPDATNVWTGTEVVVLPRNGTTFTPSPVASVLLLDPTTATWRRSAAPIPDTIDKATSVVAGWTGHEMVVVTDGGQLATYDPRVDTWRELPAIPVFADELAACPSCRSLEVDAAWTDGGLVVLRRLGATERPAPPGERVDRFDAVLVDPADGGVRRLRTPALTSPHTLLPIGPDVVATADSGGELQASVWHAATDTWTTPDPLPHGTSAFGVATVGHGGVLRWDSEPVDGTTPGTIPGATLPWSPTRVAQLDPATGRWTEAEPSAAQPAWWLGGVWAGDRLFTWGGAMPFTTSIRTVVGATWTPS